MTLKYFIRTYGCQMNVHDSERMAGMMDALGYGSTPDAESADVILLNTCAVRERPEHKLYSELGMLRKLKSQNPNLVIGVAGCMAQRDADSIRARVPEVDILLGPRNLHHLPHLLRQTQRNQENSQRADAQREYSRHEHADGLDLECDPTPATPVRRASAISAYVDVIFGCNFNCTYCAVPSARGREVSRTPGEILDEVRRLDDLGYREITLLGQTVNAYGHDLEKLPDGSRMDFARLLEQINAINPDLRIRFTSPHPMYFNSKLVDAIAQLPAVCEHLHMPLQSGDNDCLHRMKRTYTIEKYRGIVDAVRAKIPDVAVTTDAIVGFCGESETEFQNTLQAFREIEFDQAYMFAYSPRHSTAAWEWEDDISPETKSRRLSELIALQNEIGREKNRALVGQKLEILVEGQSDKDATRLQGRSRANKLVIFPGELENYPVGSLVEVETQDAFLWGFIGRATAAGSTPRRKAPPKMLIELQPV
jgi:tRNA-2-methylthio-N6-dimethylallyladenosine synthase